MTKEEARNSLINTKVYVAGKSAEIQQKLFELGFRWLDGETGVRSQDIPFLYIHNEGFNCGRDMEIFSRHTHKEITADYILNLTWEDKPKFQPFDKVLMRDGDAEYWSPSLYCNCCASSGMELWQQIIPYESNEHLAYTDNKPE